MSLRAMGLVLGLALALARGLILLDLVGGAAVAGVRHLGVAPVGRIIVLATELIRARRALADQVDRVIHRADLQMGLLNCVDTEHMIGVETSAQLSELRQEQRRCRG